MPVEFRPVEVAHLLAVEEDAAGVIGVILEQQLGQRRFAAAALAHKSGFLGALEGEGCTVQDGFGRTGIGETDVLAGQMVDLCKRCTVRSFGFAGHGGFQPGADAARRFDFGIALGDLVAGRNDKVCHTCGGGHGADGDLSAEHQQQADQQHHREDQVADERGVHHHGIQALLVGQLAFLSLAGGGAVLGTVRILPQESADQLKPAQQLFQLAGVLRHLRRKCVAGVGQPGIHHPGQHQRRDGHNQNRHQQHGADKKVQPQRTEHDAAPEHEVEE